MSWAYWGIVSGLAALVVMLIACLRLLSSNGDEDRQGARPGADEPVDMHPKPPTIHRRAA